VIPGFQTSATSVPPASTVSHPSRPASSIPDGFGQIEQGERVKMKKAQEQVAHWEAQRTALLAGHFIPGMNIADCEKALDLAKDVAARHQSNAAMVRNQRRHIEDRIEAAQADPSNPNVSLWPFLAFFGLFWPFLAFFGLFWPFN
jgi:hypothetical protein